MPKLLRVRWQSKSNPTPNTHNNINNWHARGWWINKKTTHVTTSHHLNDHYNCNKTTATENYASTTHTVSQEQMVGKQPNNHSTISKWRNTDYNTIISIKMVNTTRTQQKRNTNSLWPYGYFPREPQDNIIHKIPNTNNTMNEQSMTINNYETKTLDN